MSIVGMKIGNYDITRILGEGGMGAVYLGEHPLIGKKVAVKVLHDQLAAKKDIVQRFFTEAKSVNDIHHENIVDIVDFGEMKDATGKTLVYFVMELLEGDGLSARLKRERLTASQAVHVSVQCAGALAASHSHHIVHRDIKPDNIFLVRRREDDLFVKLLDFGIAKLTGDDTQATGMTRAGSVIGTPAYMSPEQCDGRGNVDHRADVYSLGIVMYEMLCGRGPFTGESFGEILVAHLTQVPPRLIELAPGIPLGLETIVMRCLEKQKDARFQTMDELRDALMQSESYVPPRPVTGLMQAIHLTGMMAPVRTPTGAVPVMPTLGTNTPVPVQKPTTLSGATGEASDLRPPTRKSPMPIFAAIGGLVLAGGIAAVVLLKPGPAAPPPPAVAPVATITSVHILIDSTPQGAQILRAGIAAPLGKTPYETKLKKGIPPFDVLLVLDGYKSEPRTITTENDRDVLVSLTKSEPPPVQAVVPTTAAGSSRSGGSRGHTSTHLPRLPGADSEGTRPQPKPDNPDPDGVLAPKL